MTWRLMQGVAGSPPTTHREWGAVAVSLLALKTSIMPTTSISVVPQAGPMINCFSHNYLNSFFSSFFPPWTQLLRLLFEKSLRRNASEFPRRSCWKWLGEEMSEPPCWGCQSPNVHDFEYMWVFSHSPQYSPSSVSFFFPILPEGKWKFTGNCLIDAVTIVWAQPFDPEVVSFVYEFTKTTLTCMSRVSV